MIKKLQPLHNRQQRRVDSVVSLQGQLDQHGYINLTAEWIKPDQIPDLGQLYGVFRSEKQATEVLAAVAKAYHLCNKLLGVEKVRGACFAYQLKRCLGACAQSEDPLSCNSRL